jgi:hypothetical protein
MAGRVEGGHRLTPQRFQEIGLTARLSCAGAPRCFGEAEGSAVRRRRRASATARLGIASVGGCTGRCGRGSPSFPSGRLIRPTDSPEIFCALSGSARGRVKPAACSRQDSGIGPAGSIGFAAQVLATVRCGPGRVCGYEGRSGGLGHRRDPGRNFRRRRLGASG